MQDELVKTDLMLKKWAAWNEWDQLNPGFVSKTVLCHLIKEGAFYQTENRLHNISRDTPTDVIHVDQAIRALNTRELIDVIKMKYLHLRITDEKRITMFSELWGHAVNKPAFRKKVDYARWFIAGYLCSKKQEEVTHNDQLG